MAICEYLNMNTHVVCGKPANIAVLDPSNCVHFFCSDECVTDSPVIITAMSDHRCDNRTTAQRLRDEAGFIGGRDHYRADEPKFYGGRR